MISRDRLDADTVAALFNMASTEAVNLIGTVKAFELGPLGESSEKRHCKFRIKILSCASAQPDGFAVPLYRIRLNAEGLPISKKAVNTLHGEWTPSLAFPLTIFMKSDAPVPQVGDRVKVENLVSTFDKKAGKRFTCDKLVLLRSARERSPPASRRPVAAPWAVSLPATSGQPPVAAPAVLVEEILSRNSRAIPLSDAKEVLRQWGVPEAELKDLTRWPAVWKLKKLAQAKVAAGETNPHIVRLSKSRLFKRLRYAAEPEPQDDSSDADEAVPLEVELPDVALAELSLSDAISVLRRWGAPSDSLTNLSRHTAIRLVHKLARKIQNEGTMDPLVLRWATEKEPPDLTNPFEDS